MCGGAAFAMTAAALEACRGSEELTRGLEPLTPCLQDGPSSYPAGLPTSDDGCSEPGREGLVQLACI